MFINHEIGKLLKAEDEKLWCLRKVSLVAVLVTVGSRSKNSRRMVLVTARLPFKERTRIRDEECAHTRVTLTRASAASPDYSASVVVSSSCLND